MSDETRKACEGCGLIYSGAYKHCQDCGAKLMQLKKDDAFLKRFLRIDDKTLGMFKQIREETIEEAKKLNLKKGPIKALGISGSARDAYDMAGESSNSEFLLQEALKSLEKEGIVTELIQLRKLDIKPCKACYSTTNTQCHFHCSCYPKGTAQGDDMSNGLYDKILEADIILFATPVNNFKISSYMSLFLDRCISLDGSLQPADPNATKNKELNIKHTKFVQIMADDDVIGSGFLRRFSGKVGGIIVTGHEEGAAMAISQLFMTLSHYGMAFPPWSNMYAMASISNPTFKDKKLVTQSEYAEWARDVAQNALTMAKKLKGMGRQGWKYDKSSN